MESKDHSLCTRSATASSSATLPILPIGSTGPAFARCPIETDDQRAVPKSASIFTTDNFSRAAALTSAALHASRKICGVSFDIAKFSTRLGLGVAQAATDNFGNSPIVSGSLRLARLVSLSSIQLANNIADVALHSTQQSVDTLQSFVDCPETLHAVSQFAALVQRELSSDQLLFPQHNSTHLSLLDRMRYLAHWALLQRRTRRVWFERVVMPSLTCVAPTDGESASMGALASEPLSSIRGSEVKKETAVPTASSSVRREALAECKVADAPITSGQPVVLDPHHCVQPVMLRPHHSHSQARAHRYLLLRHNLIRYSRFCEAAYGELATDHFSGKTLERFADRLSERVLPRVSDSILHSSSNPPPDDNHPSPKPVSSCFRHPEGHEQFSRYVSLPADSVLLSSDALQLQSTPAQRVADALWGCVPRSYRPTFFLLIDHSSSSIVLALRGTLSFHDLMIDLTCETASLILPPEDTGTDFDRNDPRAFHVHSGMLKAAKMLADPDSPLGVHAAVCSSLRKFPQYSLVITGHSLGAGIATLLSLLWASPLTCATADRSLLPSGRALHCYAYGAPCTVSIPLATLSHRLITTITYGWDFVCRFSLGSVRDLRALSVFLCMNPEVRSTIVRDFVTDGGGQTETQEALYTLLSRLRSIVMVSGKLYPAGTLYWIMKTRAARSSVDDIGGRLDAEVGVEVAVLRPNHESTEKATESAVERCFGEIVFSKSMLTDHTPSSYAAAISRL